MKCAICGGEITEKGRRKYCSDKCAREAFRRYNNQYRRNRYATDPKYISEHRQRARKHYWREREKEVEGYANEIVEIVEQTLPSSKIGEQELKTLRATLLKKILNKKMSKDINA